MQVTHVPAFRVNLRPALRFKWTSCKSMRKSLLKSCSYHICSPVCVCAHSAAQASQPTQTLTAFPFLQKTADKKLKWARKMFCLVYEYSIGGLEPCPEPSVGNGVQHLHGAAKTCFSCCDSFQGHSLRVETLRFLS